MIVREVGELIAYHSKFGRRFAVHECRNVFGKAMKDLDSFGFGDLHGKKVLDLGCGQRFPFALQCAAEGAEVTALDIDYVKPDTLPVAFLKTIKQNGFKRACKSTLRKMFFDNTYYESLEETAGKALRRYQDEISFATADPAQANYPLPSEFFDLIASNAVLEHVVNVEEYVNEITRLLKKDGLFYGIMHNFYSLSGGHNVEWAFPDETPSKKVPPWDHLRKNLYPSWSYLNRLKPRQYKSIFSDKLKVLLFEGRDIHHDPGHYEGEQFLTKELERELAAYPPELLLTRAYCIICQKK
jgi:SAM-dependent methyltransferase